MQSGAAQMDALQALIARKRATEPQFQQFVRGLASVMNQWTALHLVAQHCDSHAFQSLYEEVVAWHRDEGELYSDELEMFFEDFFAMARSVVIEDDSMKEVADVLHDMYCRCCVDDFSRVEHFVATEVIYRRENPVAMCVCSGDSADINEELGGVTFGEGEGDEQDDDNEEDDNEEEVVQQRPKNNNRRKNASVKDKNGWRIIL